jgi:hypothetical protein
VAAIVVVTVAVAEFSYVSRTTHLVSSPLKNQSYLEGPRFTLGEFKSLSCEPFELSKITGRDLGEYRRELYLLHEILLWSPRVGASNPTRRGRS